MAVDRLFTFSLGDLPVPLEFMVPGWDPADTGPVPMGTILAHAPEGWFLFDVGLSVDFRRTEVWETLFQWGPPVLPGTGDPLLDALDACGVAVGDIHRVVLSHMHSDHTGGLRHFGGDLATPVIVQQAELDHVASGEAGPFTLPQDWEPYGVRFAPIQGEAEIATGIVALPSPGHTPGHQSFLVTLASGEKLLFAYDAIPISTNLEWGVATGIVSGDPALPKASQDALVARAAAEGARIIPGHCARTWAAMPAPPVSLA